MTRDVRRPARSGAVRKPTAGDPYGIRVRPGAIVPIAAAAGLVVVAILTLGLFSGRLPFVPSRGGGGGAVVDRTPAPSNVVIVDPRSSVPGSIVYAKGGNVWIQSGTKATQVTSSGHDSMPTWSADGRWIYYVETRTERGLYPYTGAPVFYDLTYPIVVRIRPDGTGRDEIATGRFTRSGGQYQWFYWIRQPVPDPSGKTLAVMSDGPEPTRNDVVLQLLDIASGTLTNPGLAENAPLGHQDPAWKPGSSRQLLYVMNGRDGTRGAPTIWRYDVRTKRATVLTAPGYMGPAWSPDGRLIVATKQGSLGTDLVMIDPSTGTEVKRITNDAHSWGATWSPNGDAIAFLHIDGGIVDLRMVPIHIAGGVVTVGEDLSLTESSGLDPASRPSWYIPPDQLTPAASSSPSSSGSAGP